MNKTEWKNENGQEETPAAAEKEESAGAGERDGGIQTAGKPSVYCLSVIMYSTPRKRRPNTSI